MFDHGDNSMQDSRVTSAIVVAGGIVGALLVGTSIAEGSLLPSAIFGAAAVATIVLMLQQRIWILIPIFWYLTGRLGFLPLSLSARDMAVRDGRSRMRKNYAEGARGYRKLVCLPKTDPVAHNELIASAFA